MFSLAKWAKPSGCTFKTSAITVCINYFKLVLRIQSGEGDYLGTKISHELWSGKVDVFETLVIKKTTEIRIGEIPKGISPVRYVLQCFVLRSC